MGLFSFGKRLLKGAASVTKLVDKAPVVGSVARALPFVGAAMTAVQVGSSLLGGSKGGGALPALPMPQGAAAGLPMIPGANAPATMGSRSIFRNDPNVVEALKPYAISMHNLKQYYRAPRGFVIVHDQVGDPYALPRKLAQMARLWKPAHKPPISVGEWQSIKKADRTVKKMKKIFRMTAHVEKNVKGGKVKVRKGKHA